MTGPTDPDQQARRFAVRLEYATIAWNTVEVFATIGLGIAAHSLALIAFGMDSIVEIFASSVVLWHLRGLQAPRQTQRALKLVATAFFVLAALLLAGGVRNLLREQHPDDAPFGVAYLAVTACVMWGLAIAKRAVSVKIGNHPLVHEARVTFLDGMLAAGILVALAANIVFGWWWADSTAAIVVAFAAIAEGIEAPKQHPPVRGA